MVKDISKLPDFDLVQNVKENACSDSFNELSSRHSNLFYKVSQNYARIICHLGKRTLRDVFEEKDIVLFEAISKFKPDKGTKFSTWLGSYTRFWCLNQINKHKGMPEIGSEEEMQAIFHAKAIEIYETECELTVDMSAIFKTLEETDDRRITNIFRLRYDPNLTKKRTWASIAIELDLTVPTTIQLHKKGLKLLREEISNKNLNVFEEI